MIFLVTTFQVHAEGACPPAQALPVLTDEDRQRQSKWAGVAEPRSVYDDAGGYDYAHLGVGHLRIEGENALYYDWQKAVSIPLWQTPWGQLYAWIYAGAVHPVDGSAATPLSGAGMVETDYEQLTFVVFEKRDDGWLRIRVGIGGVGNAWTHECHLGLSEIKLAYQSWESVIDEHGEWLIFRARVPHALREKPTTRSRRITWIGLDHEFTLLERAGDWLRVRVRQPGWNCVGSDKEFSGRIDDGWVKWRDEKTGPWVWYYTRGC